MSPNRRNIPTTYAEALALLNGRESRTIANNTRLHVLDDGAIGMWLHATCIVTFRVNGSIVLNTGGYHTVTTKDRINRVARGHGWSVYAKRFDWYVSAPDGSEFEFEDGVTIPPPRPRLVSCVDCGTEYDHSGIASRGYPPLCGRCFTARLARPEPDARVEGHGSVVLVRPLGETVRAWLRENTDGTWFGGALAVEPRYVLHLVAGMRDAGFRVAARG